MRSLYLDDTSTPGGEIDCAGHCSGVAGSDYFSFNAGDSVSVAVTLFGNSLMLTILRYIGLFVLAKL